MMLRAAEAEDVNAMIYAAVDLCFTQTSDSQLRAIMGDQRQANGLHSKGVAFLRGAVDRHNPDAAFLMGNLLAEGRAGLSKNEALAEKYFEKATEWSVDRKE